MFISGLYPGDGFILSILLVQPVSRLDAPLSLQPAGFITPCLVQTNEHHAPTHEFYLPNPYAERSVKKLHPPPSSDILVLVLWGPKDWSKKKHHLCQIMIKQYPKSKMTCSVISR